MDSNNPCDSMFVVHQQCNQPTTALEEGACQAYTFEHMECRQTNRLYYPRYCIAVNSSKSLSSDLKTKPRMAAFSSVARL